MGGVIERVAPGVVLTIDAERGGRIAQLRVEGRDLLVPKDHADPHPMLWGSFPMVPWAGRLRHGRFRFSGRDHQMPLDLPPHAIHGLGYVRPWDVEPTGDLTLELGAPWPFGGRAVQRFTLGDASLTCTLEVHAEESMPAQVGWHPWFARPVTFDLAPSAMYELDAESIPTGRLVAVPPGPWDDCFCDLRRPPRLAWSDGPVVTVTSSCTDWVVYDRPAHAVCVEPQAGPPDALNLAPHVVEPGVPLVATMTLRWASA